LRSADRCLRPFKPKQVAGKCAGVHLGELAEGVRLPANSWHIAAFQVTRGAGKPLVEANGSGRSTALVGTEFYVFPLA
jgi:hypothetical protein